LQSPIEDHDLEGIPRHAGKTKTDIPPDITSHTGASLLTLYYKPSSSPLILYHPL
jgi:hypothetical protein